MKKKDLSAIQRKTSQGVRLNQFSTDKLLISETQKHRWGGLSLNAIRTNLTCK